MRLFYSVISELMNCKFCFYGIRVLKLDAVLQTVPRLEGFHVWYRTTKTIQICVYNHRDFYCLLHLLNVYILLYILLIFVCKCIYSSDNSKTKAMTAIIPPSSMLG